VSYLDVAELANNAAEYVAVLNRAKVLVELLLPSLTSCAKALGVKL
jgi:vacuolar-type H+-ATPase subunit B/Vma2